MEPFWQGHNILYCSLLLDVRINIHYWNLNNLVCSNSLTYQSQRCLFICLVSHLILLSGIFFGFQVGPKTNPSSTQCLCNHLTFFGSSFFVVPNAIDVSKTAQLFGTFVENPVVVTTVGCIFLIYVLVVIWARRKDIQDDAKVSLQLIKSMYSGNSHHA